MEETDTQYMPKNKQITRPSFIYDGPVGYEDEKCITKGKEKKKVPVTRPIETQGK